MIVYITNYLDYQKNGDFLGYLWMPHMQHRLIWIRLLTAVDVELFRGAVYPFIAFTTACLVSVPLILWREITVSGLPGDLALTVGLLATMLFLTTANVVDCSIPINGIYPHTLVFAVVAIVLLAGSSADPQSYGWRRIAALAAAMGAASGSLVGLVIWPILIWISWRMRARAPWVLMVCGIGAAFGWIYANGVLIPQSASSVLDMQSGFYTSAHMRKVGEYFLNYMGLPWTRATELAEMGRIIGAILSAAGLFIVAIRTFDNSTLSHLDLIGLGLIMFSLATGVFASIGRVDELPYVAVPVRYSVYLAPLHVGLLVHSLPLVQKYWQASRARKYIQAGVILAAAILVTQQFLAGRAATAVADNISIIVHRFMDGERAPEMVPLVFVDLVFAEYFYKTLYKEGLYVGRK